MPATASISVRLGSSLGSGVGRTRVTVRLPDGSTVGEIVEELGRLYPQLALPLQAAMPVVDGTVTSRDQTLSGHDSIAFVMPVAGG